MSLLSALFPDARDASGPNDSCDGDADDDLLPELTENPETTRGIKLTVLLKILSHFRLIVVFLTADPLTAISVVFAKLA